LLICFIYTALPLCCCCLELLQHTATHTATQYNTLQQTASLCISHCITQCSTLLKLGGAVAWIYFNKLQYNATHTAIHTATTLQHTATRCSTPGMLLPPGSTTHFYTLEHTLQVTATHCNTLPHTAAHWNILRNTALPRRCYCLEQQHLTHEISPKSAQNSEYCVIIYVVNVFESKCSRELTL